LGVDVSGLPWQRGNEIVYARDDAFLEWLRTFKAIRNRVRRSINTNSAINRRAQRAALRKKLTGEFSTNLHRAMMQHVFNPIDLNQTVIPPADEVETYFSAVFQNPAESGFQLQPLPAPFQQALNSMKRVPEDVTNRFQPITQSEIQEALKHAKSGTSPGLDGIPIGVWKTLGSLALPQLTKIFNSFLTAGVVAPAWSESLSVLLPKKEGAHSLADGHFRPVTMESCVFKLITYILTQRILDLEDQFSFFSLRQKGFLRNKLGIIEAAYLAHAAVDNSARFKKPLFVLLVDLANAFGSVPHEVMQIAMKLHGIPTYICRFVQNLYAHAKTTFKTSTKGAVPELTNWIDIDSGVLQGDSLSPLLFNLVINLLLLILDADENSGYKFTVHHAGNRELATRSPGVAVADDITLFASSEDGLRQLSNTVETFCTWANLRVRPAKCSLLVQRWRGGRRDREPVLDRPLRFHGQEVPILPHDSAVRLLGSPLGLFHSAENQYSITSSVQQFRERLERLSKLPLHPAMRLRALQASLIPSLEFLLRCPSAFNLKDAQTLDRQIRSCVRKWLWLPHGSPNAAFYARRRDGGLHLPMLQQRMQAGKLSAFVSMLESVDPTVKSVLAIDMENTRCIRNIPHEPDRQLISMYPATNVELDVVAEPTIEVQRNLCALPEADAGASFPHPVNEPGIPDGAYRVYTDGSCRGNGTGQAAAGVGVAFGVADPRNVTERLQGAIQTNQRAELTAAIRAVQEDVAHRRLQLDPTAQPLDLATDSAYVIRHVQATVGRILEGGGARQRALRASNSDLLQEFANVLLEYREIVGTLPTFTKILAHANVPGNEIADRLAKWGTTLPNTQIFALPANALAEDLDTDAPATLQDLEKVVEQAYPKLPTPHWLKVLSAGDRATNLRTQGDIDNEAALRAVNNLDADAQQAQDEEAEPVPPDGRGPPVPFVSPLDRRPRQFFGFSLSAMGRLPEGRGNDRRTGFIDAGYCANWCAVQVYSDPLTPLEGQHRVFVRGKEVANPGTDLFNVLNEALCDDAYAVWANHAHTGKSAAYLRDNAPSSRWLEGTYITQQAYRFGWRARLTCAPTPTNIARWSSRPNQPAPPPAHCRRGCQHAETLSHQVCGCQHLANMYTARHDRVLRRFLQEFRRSEKYRQWSTQGNAQVSTYLDEPNMPAELKRLRPDIFVYNRDRTQAYILDVTVVHTDSNTSSYECRSEQKRQKYQPLVTWLVEHRVFTAVDFVPLTFGAIGIVPRFTLGLMKKLKLGNDKYTAQMAHFICLDLLHASSQIFDHANRGATANRSNAPVIRNGLAPTIPDGRRDARPPRARAAGGGDANPNRIPMRLA
jgi:ribonuclease HI